MKFPLHVHWGFIRGEEGGRLRFISFPSPLLAFLFSSWGGVWAEKRRNGVRGCGGVVGGKKRGKKSMRGKKKKTFFPRWLCYIRKNSLAEGRKWKSPREKVKTFLSGHWATGFSLFSASHTPFYGLPSSFLPLVAILKDSRQKNVARRPVENREQHLGAWVGGRIIDKLPNCLVAWLSSPRSSHSSP